MSDYGIRTYADLAETCCGMVLANEIASRPLEPVSGDWAPGPAGYHLGARAAGRAADFQYAGADELFPRPALGN